MAESRVRRIVMSLRSAVLGELVFPSGTSARWDWETMITGDADYGTGIANAREAYTKEPIVRNAINTLAHFATRKGFHTVVEAIEGEGDQGTIDRVKKEVDEVNRLVNMDLVLSIGIVKREIWGRTGFNIVRDDRNKIVRLQPLRSSGLMPILDETTMTIESYKYIQAGSEGGEKVIPADQMLYFVRDALEVNMVGTSAVDTVSQTVKLKRNLSRDLLETARRLWAPIGLFEVDTSNTRDPNVADKQVQKFADEIKPGVSIVTNQKVTGKIFDLKADVGAIIRGIEKADEELMGNWNIPKALLSREKTLSKATLEYSLKALYEGPVESIQRYYRREIERQFYAIILKDMGLQDKYVIKHVWNHVALYDPELINALGNAVAKGAMTREEMFDIMGWEMKGEPNNLPDVYSQRESIADDLIRRMVKSELEKSGISMEEISRIIEERGD